LKEASYLIKYYYYYYSSKESNNRYIYILDNNRELYNTSTSLYNYSLALIYNNLIFNSIYKKGLISLV